jgi:hypothetical protein
VAIDELLSSIGIRPKNKLLGKVGVIGVREIDLPADIQPRIHFDFDGNISVRVTNTQEIDGSILVIANGSGEINASIWPRIISDLPGSIGIKPNTRMFGIVEVVQPPTISTVLTPISDAFVRDGIPKLNYGTEEDMFAGRSCNSMPALCHRVMPFGGQHLNWHRLVNQTILQY